MLEVEQPDNTQYWFSYAIPTFRERISVRHHSKGGISDPSPTARRSGLFGNALFADMHVDLLEAINESNPDYFVAYPGQPIYYEWVGSGKRWPPP